MTRLARTLSVVGVVALLAVAGAGSTPAQQLGPDGAPEP